MVRISAVEGSEQRPVGSPVDLTKTIVGQCFRVVGDVAELTVWSSVFGLLAVSEVVRMRPQKG
jgi:hypothetical protein